MSATTLLAWLSMQIVSTAPADFPQLPVGAPIGSGETRPCEIEGLVGRARCGIFRVPENRSSAADTPGRTIDIAFVVLLAQDTAARLSDPLIPLPGGPGQSFTGAAADYSRRYGTLRQRRDVLLVDTRGVGRSGALSCDVPLPGGFASRFGTLFPLDHVASCRDTLSTRAALDQYTTDASVRDIEDVRRWLGYSSVNLIGVSYGTRVAQAYLRAFPGAVRTVVFNGVSAIDKPLYVQHAFLLQRALDRVVAECRADTDCHRAYPALPDQLRQLFDRFAGGPVAVTVHDKRVLFGRGDLAYALRGLLYNRGENLPAMIAEASTGSLEPLARYYVERLGWIDDRTGHAGLHWSVLCAEDIASTTDAQVAVSVRGTFAGDHIIASYRAACREWLHATLPSSWFEPVRSAVPALLLSGARDPVTPPEDADRVAAHLTNSLHIVVPNGGHAQSGSCVDRLVAHLVNTASVRELDASCIAAVPQTKFRTAR